MTPLKALEQMVKVLEKNKVLYCLVGGHAASLYRSQERMTRDADFALCASPLAKARFIAEKVIKEAGFTPFTGLIPLGDKEPKRAMGCIVSSKPSKTQSHSLIDILLPELPWVESAVKRAQENKLNLGFAKVPVITPEDLIIAKCYSLRNTPDRFQDLDDIKEIFLGVKEIDITYIQAQLKAFALRIPEALNKFTPKRLRGVRKRTLE